MNTFGYGKQLEKYENVDEEELLATLTAEELQELERELADIEPDDEIPIGLRQQDQTARRPTGAFSREALLKYWETEELTEGETRDSKPQSSMEERQTDNEDERGVTGGTDQSSALANADRNVKRDRPVSGTGSGKQRDQSQQLNGGLSPDQDHGKDTRLGPRKLRGPKGPTVAPNHKIKSTREGQATDNTIDIDEVLEKVKGNEKSLLEVNLNNVKDISMATLVRFAEALTSNTHVQVFSLANTRADDHVAASVAQMLLVNSTVATVNMDSNFLSGRGILALMAALAHNRTLVELRFHNQRHVCGGRVEMEMVQLLRANKSLLKLGYQFELAGPRMTATQHLTRNQDLQRQLRLQQRLLQVDNVTKHNNSASKVDCHGYDKDPEFPVKFTTTSCITSNHQQSPSELEKRKTPPTRQIAKMIRQHQGSGTNSKCESRQKSEKLTVEAENRKNVGILLDMKSALKPSSARKIKESKLKESVQAQVSMRTTHGDLMEAIRGSSIRALRRAREN